MDSLADPLRSLRTPDRRFYPELDGLDRDAIYVDTFGGGALYLAAHMARKMDLQPGEVVLDLGAGKGATSVFLAQRYGVQVVALDLWTPADHLATRVAQLGLRDRILPLQMDATHPLPFADGYFDAIFCQNSLNFYGGSVEFLHHLLRCLKPGGAFGVGMETVSAEFSPEEREHPPAVFNYNLPYPYEHINTWVEDFSKMYSPGWWADLFRASGLLDVLSYGEVEDADILYEDLIRYQMEHNLDPDDVAISLKQLAWGRDHSPRKTLMVLQARKRR